MIEFLMMSHGQADPGHPRLAVQLEKSRMPAQRRA
jgi:hypothetical protein